MTPPAIRSTSGIRLTSACNGTGPCSVTPTTEVIGSCQWGIRTYNVTGLGPWSSPLSFTVPPPAAAIPGSPSGTITSTTPTYTWNAVSNAAKYYLWVKDYTGNKIQKWYSAAEAACASGTGTCSVTPTTEVIGSCQWWIQTYNTGFGPWSDSLSFTTPSDGSTGAAALISPLERSQTLHRPMPGMLSLGNVVPAPGRSSTGIRFISSGIRQAVGCPDGTGTCSVTPTTEVLGSYQWYIRPTTVQVWPGLRIAVYGEPMMRI
jgi:hypothetical protein